MTDSAPNGVCTYDGSGADFTLPTYSSASDSNYNSVTPVQATTGDDGTTGGDAGDGGTTSTFVPSTTVTDAQWEDFIANIDEVLPVGSGTCAALKEELTQFNDDGEQDGVYVGYLMDCFYITDYEQYKQWYFYADYQASADVWAGVVPHCGNIMIDDAVDGDPTIKRFAVGATDGPVETMTTAFFVP